MRLVLNIFLLIVFFLQSSCQKKNISNINNSIIVNNEIENYSFVVSCGSGCALTYNFKDFTDISDDFLESLLNNNQN